MESNVGANPPSNKSGKRGKTKVAGVNSQHAARKSNKDADAHHYDKSNPSYPFSPEFELEIDSARIGVIRHLCHGHPSKTHTMVLFFPGVHGGVGPCRTPGSNFCENALYPTLAAKLSSHYDIDCYRCSWPYMRPRLGYAVRAGCRVLQKALEDACAPLATATELDTDEKIIDGDGSDVDRHIRVFFVGHSLGGMVSLQTSLVAARYVSQRRFGNTNVSVAGICTLNGAVDCRQAEENPEMFDCLQNARALLIAGDADAVVPPEATEELYKALPMTSKQHLLMPGGEHDLYTCKAQLLDELESFLTADLKS